jgi:hypothetical protein
MLDENKCTKPPNMCGKIKHVHMKGSEFTKTEK